MKYRKLRIAWSVVWGIAAVLLVVLWVRSYWWSDEIIGETQTCYPYAGSQIGYLVFGMPSRHILEHADNADWTLHSYPVRTPVGNEKPKPLIQRVIPAFLVPKYPGFILPYWFVVLAALTFTVGPWTRQLHFRFTLRTLLIVTTIVAIVLGLIVWATR